MYKHTFSYKDSNTKVIPISGTVSNKVQKAPFEVIKITSNDNTVTEVVENAEFTAILTKYVTYYGSFDEALKHLDQYAEDEYSIFRTSSNGHGTSGLLAWGDYTVRETYTPSPEIEAVEDFYVKIDKDSKTPINEIVANDYPFKAYIKLIKQDKKTDKVVTLSNATFNLYKLNEDNNTWEKVSCKVGKNYYDSWTTDKEGIARTENKLEAGHYKCSELVIPNGFLQLDEDVIFDVNNRNKTLNYDKDLDAWITVTIKNEQPVGELVIDKSVALRENIDTSLVDVSDLSKIKFKLVATENVLDMADGSIIYPKDKEVGTYSLSKEGDLTISNLPMGKYEFFECATLDGLVLDETRHQVEFTQKDTTTKVYSDTREVINDTTVVKISKQDIGGNEIKGATLQVINKNGEIVDEWVSTDIPHTIEGLKVNESYTLHEEICVNEFVKATDVEFTVTNTNEIQSVTMIDKVLEVSKQDIGGNEIEGATLQVIDKNNKVVDEWISTNTPHRVSGLIEGEKYTLHEEICVDGFVKATDVEFEVTTDKETQKIIMIDKVVSLSKQDIGGNEIEGAEMTVTDENNEIVDSWTSTKEPHHISNLEEGKKYVLHELYAPDTFVIATDVEFEVTTDKETQEIILVDKTVEISKQDIEGNEIEGATLVVTNAKTKNIIDKWVSTNIPHKVSGLIEGEKYTLHEEICVDGFVKATDVEFEVTTDKETQKVIMIDKIVDVTKTDLVNGEEVEGAELVVTDEDGNIVDEWVSTKEHHHVSGLEEGKNYVLTEKTAPYGFEVAESINFTVTTDKATQVVEMKDMPILRSVRVEKVDKATGEHIKSNKFEFNLYEDEACTKLLKTVGANEFEGTALFEDLRFGTFYIKERKSTSRL